MRFVRRPALQDALFKLGCASWVYSVSSFGWQKIVHVRTLNYPRPIPSMLEIPPDEKTNG